MQVVQVYFVYMDRRNPSQEWEVNYANRNNVWHFLNAIIWGMWWFFGKDKNLYIFALFYFVFDGDFQVQDPGGRGGGLISGGAILRKIFCVTNMGAYVWRGLFSQFYGIFPKILDAN